MLLNRLIAKRWQPFHTKERDLAASTKVEAFADPVVYADGVGGSGLKNGH
jgi:hypothetical protein